MPVFRPLDNAVDPAEAERFFHRVQVPERFRVRGAAALHEDPALLLLFVVLREPRAQLLAILRGEEVHKITGITLAGL